MSYIIGISTVGTYWSHIDATIASMYHLCDKIIVANGGYDINNPDRGDNIPVERDKDLIKDVDIYNKVQQIKPTWKGVKNIQKGRSEAGRDRNMSLVVQAAYKLGADIVLKIDADEIIGNNVERADLEYLYKQSSKSGYNKVKVGYRFGMWELWGDFYHYQQLPSWASEDNKHYPSSNDAPQFYKPNIDDWYIGGSPVVKTAIIPYQKLLSYHVRSVPPTDVDPFEYFYRRYWYHYYFPMIAERERGDREFDLTLEDISRKAKEDAYSSAKICETKQGLSRIDPNAIDPRVPKETPLVISLGPKEYIKYKQEMENVR